MGGSEDFEAGKLPDPVVVDGPPGSRDAFARWRTSNPQTLFESTLVYGKLPLIWDEALTGTATSTHSAANARVRMAVATGDSAIRQTRMRFPYQPGKSQELLFTGVMSAESGVVKRIGAYNGTDGVYFEMSGTTPRVVIEKGGVPTAVDQDDWDDPLDGSGPSRVTIDFDFAQIFAIDFEWLGVGQVRFGFFSEGRFVLAHAVTNANAITSVYMATPNLPLRYSIVSSGGSGTLDQICCSVSSGGGADPSGVQRSIDTGPTAISLGSDATDYAMLALRAQSDKLDAFFEEVAVNVISRSGGDNFRWRLVLNPTLSAGSFSFSDVATSSPLEVAVGDGTQTVSSQEMVIAGGFVAADSSQSGQTLRSVLRPGVKLDGTRDILALLIRPQNGSGSFSAELAFREIP